MELAGKGVLITGASRGIGAALAEGFAAAGSRVMLVARSREALTEIATRVGGSAHPADLSDPAGVEELVRGIEAEAGPVDVLVSNAAVAFPRHILDQTTEEISQTTTVNYLASVLLARVGIPGMLRRGQGHVVFVIGMAEALAIPGLTPFGAAGAGLAAFARGLRLELAGGPVGVTTAVLGPVRTGLYEDLLGYGPYREAVGYFRRLQVLRESEPGAVAAAVLDAVRRGRRRVVLPRRLAPLIAMREAPGRLGELLQGRLGARSIRPGPGAASPTRGDGAHGA